MPGPYETTLHRAAETLGVSERTVQRYVKQGLLTVEYVKTKNGREARYSGNELLDLLETPDVVGAKALRQQHATGGGGVMGDVAGQEFLKDLIEKLNDAVGRARYLQGQRESEENAVKLISENAESLRKELNQTKDEKHTLEQENQQLKVQKFEKEREIAELKADMAEGKRDHEKQVGEKERKINELRTTYDKKSNKLRLILSAATILLVASLIAIALLEQESIRSILG